MLGQRVDKGNKYARNYKEQLITVTECLLYFCKLA